MVKPGAPPLYGFKSSVEGVCVPHVTERPRRPEPERSRWVVVALVLRAACWRQAMLPALQTVFKLRGVLLYFM